MFCSSNSQPKLHPARNGIIDLPQPVDGENHHVCLAFGFSAPDGSTGGGGGGGLWLVLVDSRAQHQQIRRRGLCTTLEWPTIATLTQTYLFASSPSSGEETHQDIRAAGCAVN